MDIQRLLQIFDPEDLITKFQPQLYESTLISLVNVRHGHCKPNQPLLLVSAKSSPQKVIQLLAEINRELGLTALPNANAKYLFLLATVVVIILLRKNWI